VTGSVDELAARRLAAEGITMPDADDARRSLLEELGGDLMPAKAAPDKPNPIRQLANYVRAAFALGHHEGQGYAVARDELPGRMTPPGIAEPLGRAFERHLVRLAPIVTGAPITRGVLDAVMLELDAQAHQGPEMSIALRFHHDPSGGRVVIDLGRPGSGAVVVVTAAGWRVEDQPPPGVVFRRSHATKPLPDPEPGQLLDLARILRLDPAGEAFQGLVGWLLGLPFAASVRPGLLLIAQPGAGKSTALRLTVSVVEPSGTAALGSAFGRNFADDQVRAVHRPVPLWDNLTSVSGAVSDALCCLVTGTARETRALYSDNALNVVPIARPVGLTAVSVPAGLRPDALDRLITVDLPPVAERIDDAQLQADFDAAHPALLGGLCNAVASVLALWERIPPPTEYRMAGHARVLAAVDAATALGLPTGCPPGLLHAYGELNRRTKVRTVAEDTFGGALLGLLEAAGGSWSGKASELLFAAGMHAGMGDRIGAGWPTSARRVPEVLNHLRDGLAALGVEWSTTTVRGKTRYTFVTRQEAPL